jgi:hypothetical protein
MEINANYRRLKQKSEGYYLTLFVELYLRRLKASLVSLEMRPLDRLQ